MDRGLFISDPVAYGFDLRGLGVIAGVSATLFDRAVVGARFDWYNPNVDSTASQAGRVVVAPRDLWTVDLPPNLAFRAVADFASDLPLDARDILFAAVDASGRVGPRRTLPLTVRSSLPDAPLAVVLDWDRAVDLDLTVYLPDGTALSARAPRLRRRAEGALTRDRR